MPKSLGNDATTIFTPSGYRIDPAMLGSMNEPMSAAARAGTPRSSPVILANVLARTSPVHPLAPLCQSPIFVSSVWNGNSNVPCLRSDHCEPGLRPGPLEPRGWDNGADEKKMRGCVLGRLGTYSSRRTESAYIAMRAKKRCSSPCVRSYDFYSDHRRQALSNSTNRHKLVPAH